MIGTLAVITIARSRASAATDCEWMRDAGAALYLTLALSGCVALVDGYYAVSDHVAWRARELRGRTERRPNDVFMPFVTALHVRYARMLYIVWLACWIGAVLPAAYLLAGLLLGAIHTVERRNFADVREDAPVFGPSAGGKVALASLCVCHHSGMMLSLWLYGNRPVHDALIGVLLAAQTLILTRMLLRALLAPCKAKTVARARFGSVELGELPAHSVAWRGRC